MSITMRVIQRFDFKHEEDFMALERKFAELEAARTDFPKGRRMQPIAGAEWRNTLIWECEFPDLDSAQKALDFFAGDACGFRGKAGTIPKLIRSAFRN